MTFTSESDAPFYDVLIIGSGFAGICMAIQLKKQRPNKTTTYCILEKECDLGGTWRDNTYPGAACDVPSALYCYSFAANHRQHGAQQYSDQQVLLDYIREVAEEYKVVQKIQYGQQVVSMNFDETKALWTVETLQKQKHCAKVVVSAVGQLHHPSLPKDIPSSFQGETFHTATFGREQRKLSDYSGKRVAVIGSGASATQIVPKLQTVCSHVYVYQRTPSYVMFKLFSANFGRHQEKFVSRFPVIRRLYRKFLCAVGEKAIFGAIRDGPGSWHERLFRGCCALNLWLAIRDPVLRAKLTPSYPFGAKRTLFSNDYYPALAQKNVSLTTCGIDRIDETCVIDRDGKHVPVDTIVYATGFNTQILRDVNVKGRSGQPLWKKGRCHAYLGVATHGFPNLFFLYGPNTNLGHNSVLLMIEEQVDFVVRVLDYMDQYDKSSLEVDGDLENQFVQEMDERTSTLPYSKVSKSWYLTEGKNHSVWVSDVDEYRQRLRNVDLSLAFR